MAGMFRCKQPFSFDVDGVSRVVSAGEVVSTADPAFKTRQELFEAAELFESLEPYLNRRAGVEQATADPGEKRSVAPVAASQTASQPAREEIARRTPARRKAGDKS